MFCWAVTVLALQYVDVIVIFNLRKLHFDYFLSHSGLFDEIADSDSMGG